MQQAPVGLHHPFLSAVVVQLIAGRQAAHALPIVDLAAGLHHHHVAQVRVAVDRGQRVAHLMPVVSLHRRSHQPGQYTGDPSGARDQGSTRHPFLLNQQVPGEAEGDNHDHQGERQNQFCAQDQRPHGWPPLCIRPATRRPLGSTRPRRQAGPRPTRPPACPATQTPAARKRAVPRRWLGPHLPPEGQR